MGKKGKRNNRTAIGRGSATQSFSKARSGGSQSKWTASRGDAEAARIVEEERTESGGGGGLAIQMSACLQGKWGTKKGGSRIWSGFRTWQTHKERKVQKERCPKHAKGARRGESNC